MRGERVRQAEHGREGRHPADVVGGRRPHDPPGAVEHREHADHGEVEVLDADVSGRDVVGDELGPVDRTGGLGVAAERRELRGVDWVLSTSDDESFHLSPAEGMASGAVPAVLPWPGVLAAIPDATLDIAGDGPASYRDTLIARARSLGAASRSIRFLGFITGAEKARALATAGVFVLPSHHENFGVAVAEAVSVGLPVVISREVQIAHLVEQNAVGIVIGTEIEPTKAAVLEMKARKAEVPTTPSSRIAQVLSTTALPPTPPGGAGDQVVVVVAARRKRAERGA